MGKGRSKNQRSGVPEASGVKPSQDIHFDLFFAKCVREKRLRAEQHREILVFFRGLSLRDREAPEIYEQALVKF